MNSILHEINETKLKRNSKIFSAVLEKNSFSPENLPQASEPIRFGSEEPMYSIVVACNPYCTPCANAHHTLEKLFEQYPDKISIAIRFALYSNSKGDDKVVAVERILKACALNPYEAIKNWYTYLNLGRFSSLYPESEDNNKQLMELKYGKLEKEQGIQLAIEESVRSIINYIQLWKLQYLLSAPFSGKVQYLRPLQQNETIDAGEELFAVVPSRYHYTAHVALLSEGLGKAKIGQNVHLMLDQFPYNEYGYVEGIISRISPLPNTNNNAVNDAAGGTTYRVYVQLKDTLTTSFGKVIPFSPEMSGKARVITQDRNLFQRLISAVHTVEK